MVATFLDFRPSLREESTLLDVASFSGELIERIAALLCCVWGSVNWEVASVGYLYYSAKKYTYDVGTLRSFRDPGW